MTKTPTDLLTGHEVTNEPTVDDLGEQILEHLSNTKFYTETPADQLTYLVESTTTLLQQTDYEEHIQLINQAHTYIEKRLPDQPTFIHDDIHLPNLRISPTENLNAIIDWEGAKLGDPAYELAKAKCRIIDLYARFTPHTRTHLQTLFRKTYNIPNTDFEERFKAYKIIYTLRTTQKMKQKMVFQPWKRQETELECWQAYDQIFNQVIENSPLSHE